MSTTGREAPNDSKIPTSIRGLDEVLLGGLIRGGFYLVQGDPGSGKTTLALQYLRSRVAQGEICLYVTLTETRRDLESTATSHGWSIEGIELCDLSRSPMNMTGQPDVSVFHPAETQLGETTQAILEAVERCKPSQVVFDGLSELRLLAGDALRYRKQLLALKAFFDERRITVLLLDDRSYPMAEIQPESLVGANIVLDRHLPGYGRTRRRLYVSKMRGADYREGYHDYQISKGGLAVHPRLATTVHHACYSDALLPSGVANLDAMLTGGLTAGTTTLLLGPAGVGKSTVAMQFVSKVLELGQKAAVYIFDEVLGTFVERTEKLCAGNQGGIRAYMAKGLLHAQQIDPAEMSPGAFAHEIRRATEAGARMIVIDSLNGYVNAMPEERFLTTHLHELFAYLNQREITTIMVVAQHGMMVGPGTSVGDIDVSYLADTVLLFRYFEADAQIKQALSIFKKRTGSHERTIRELSISPKGLNVGEPLLGFSGIMTGVPQYHGATKLLASRPSGV